MKLSIIVAMTEDRVIGKDNRLPWHYPADLKRFKKITMGHPIIMGRKTFVSIGRLLPGRQNIILSRNPEFKVEGAEVMANLKKAISLVSGAEEVFIIGGAALFAEALPKADRLYLTLIHEPVEGDTYFPPYNKSDFKVVEEEREEGLTFLVADRHLR